MRMAPLKQILPRKNADHASRRRIELEVAGSQLYTSANVLAAEARVLAAATHSDGATVTEQIVELALLEAQANGIPVNDGQAALVRSLATSGRRVQLALAPAGAGKTTALGVLADAWAVASNPSVTTGAWRLRVTAIWPRKRELDVVVPFGDVDAPVSAVLDGLQKCGALDDDVRVVELVADKRLADASDEPKTIIHLELLEVSRA